MKIRTEFYLNGELRFLEAEAETSLLDLLQRDFQQKLLRDGCRRGHCGACTVLMDDFPVASCLIPIFNLQGSHVETLSGIMESENFGHIESAFLRTGFHPCKYCAPAKIMLTESMLRRDDGPLDEETILQYTNESWCSCTSRSAFVKAVQTAENLRRKRRANDAHRRG